MMTNGRVIGGHFLNATVTTAPVGSGLVLQSGLKWRKLNEEQVASWEDVTSESKGGSVSAVGQAVAGAVLPRFISMAASAAVGAAIDSTMRPPRTVRIDWADGKTSLVKLPERLFAHMELMLKDRRVAETAPIAPKPTADDVAVPPPPPPPALSEQAFSLVSDFIKERTGGTGRQSTAAEKSDVTEQLVRLASLRDSGVLSEEEFAAKKAELLSRM